MSRFAFSGLLVIFLSCQNEGVKTFRIEDPNAPLTVETGPFGLSLSDSEGRTLFRTVGDDGESGLSFGVYDDLKSYHFYDPRDTQVAPYAARWKFAGPVVSRDEIPGGWRLGVRVDPEVGRRLEVDVTSESDVGFKITAAIVDPAPVGFFRLTLTADGDEHFYGLGERFGPVDAAGGAYEMFTDISGEISSSINEVHVPVPFFVSSRGYGLFFEDPHPSHFDMNEAGDGRIRVTFSVRESLTWHVITGPDPAEVAARYGRLTGPAALPPIWAFAPMHWRNENRDRAELIEDAMAMREHDIPTTTIWIDNPWQTAYNTFVFNDEQFPAPSDMIEQLGSLGYKAICWSTPYLDYSDDSHVREGMWTDTHGLFEEADENGYFVMDMYGNTLHLPWKSGFECARIDFTNEAAVEFWQGLIARVTSMGIVGFKLDYGEEIVPGLLGGATDFNFSDGSDGQTMHKVYSVLYHKTYRDKCLEDAGESFIIGRSSTYGGQKHVEAIWPGDLDNDFLEHLEPDPDEDGDGAVGGLPSAINALQNLSVSGFPNFGSDTGGYRGGQPDKEVLIRWSEHTALTPIMQLGGAGEHHNPWDMETYDQETLDIYHTYARLHTRLFPLFYTLASQATERGIPPVLPLGMFDPDDPEAPAWWDEYVVGRALLVAPVHGYGLVSRQVRFPAGNWINWWTRDMHAGRGTETVAAPLGTLPLFILQGAVIPMIKDDVDTFADTTYPELVTLEERRDLVYLHIIPAGSGRITLFDGTSASYEEEGATVAVTLEPGGWFDRFVVEIDWKNRADSPGVQPGAASKDGSNLEMGDDYELVYEAECIDCWALDPAGGTAAVSVAGAGTVVMN
jgi:alpha-D-xyloside xylohydrolase